MMTKMMITTPLRALGALVLVSAAGCGGARAGVTATEPVAGRGEEQVAASVGAQDAPSPWFFDTEVEGLPADTFIRAGDYSIQPGAPGFVMVSTSDEMELPSEARVPIPSSWVKTILDSRRMRNLLAGASTGRGDRMPVRVGDRDYDDSSAIDMQLMEMFDYLSQIERFRTRASAAPRIAQGRIRGHWGMQSADAPSLSRVDLRLDAGAGHAEMTYVLGPDGEPVQGQPMPAAVFALVVEVARSHASLFAGCNVDEERDAEGDYLIVEVGTETLVFSGRCDLPDLEDGGWRRSAAIDEVSQAFSSALRWSLPAPTLGVWQP